MSVSFCKTIRGAHRYSLRSNSRFFLFYLSISIYRSFIQCDTNNWDDTRWIQRAYTTNCYDYHHSAMELILGLIFNVAQHRSNSSISVLRDLRQHSNQQQTSSNTIFYELIMMGIKTTPIFVLSKQIILRLYETTQNVFM